MEPAKRFQGRMARRTFKDLMVLLVITKFVWFALLPNVLIRRGNELAPDTFSMQAHAVANKPFLRQMEYGIPIHRFLVQLTERIASRRDQVCVFVFRTCGCEETLWPSPHLFHEAMH
jgi:hypothetical protein